MSTIFRNLLIGAVLSVSLLSLAPVPAQADDYWDGYWGWYDNTYRPYYYRQYASPYVSPYRSGYMYGPSVYSYPSYPSSVYYGPRYQYGAPYGAYYGGPAVGYSELGPYGAQVRVGPVRFGWR